MADEFEESITRAYHIAGMSEEALGKVLTQYRKLRYERLLARYRYFYLLAYHYACEGEAKDSKKSKCTSIAEAYEARAERIKEGK